MRHNSQNIKAVNPIYARCRYYKDDVATKCVRVIVNREEQGNTGNSNRIDKRYLNQSIYVQS
jgi:hypothetical protein